MQQDFGVRMRTERAPTRGELIAQRLIVVDLAVEDDRQRAAMHRLRAGRREVDDRQPPVREPDALVIRYPNALGIRPARAHGLARDDQLIAIDVRRVGAVREDAVDAAHRARV